MLKNDESRTSAFLKGTTSVLIYQIVALISGFIVPKFIISYYGSAVNGLISSVNQVMSYVLLIEAGLTASLIFSLYKPLHNKDYNSINAIYSAGCKYYNKISFLCFILVLGISFIYPFFIVNNINFSYFEIVSLILFMGLPCILNFLIIGKFNIIITADKKMYVSNVGRCIYIILYTIIIVLSVKLGLSIVLAKAMALVGTLAQIIISLIFVKKHYPFLKSNENPDNNALRLRKDAFAQEIASTVQTGAPQVLLTLISGNLLIVSVYSVFNIVINGITSLILLFGSGLTAILGELIAINDEKHLNNVFASYETMLSIVYSVIFPTAFALIMPFILLYTRDVVDISYDMPIVGFLAVLNCLIYSIQLPEKTLVRAAGMYRETRYQSIAQALICVIVGGILCIWIDIYGVLLGLLISNIYRCIDFLFFSYKHILKTSLTRTLKKWGLIFIICMLVFAYVFLFPLTISNYLDWVLYGIIFCFLLFFVSVCFFSLFFKEDVKDIFSRIKKLFQRRL